MKLLIAAVGKARPSPEQQLQADYLKRLPWKITTKEIEDKSEPAQKRKAREGQLLLAACKGYGRFVALDESGKNLSSQEFADTLAAWQRQGESSFAFVIGGADGLDKTLTDAAHLVWSLGRVTWPHMLVRALLAEQLYRAHTLMSGHPYHRP